MDSSEKFLDSKEDVIYYTCKEAGITEEQFKVIEQDLWKAFSYYIANPHKVKNHISLEGLLRISVLSEKNVLKKAKNSIEYINRLPKEKLVELDYNNLKRYEEIVKHFEKKLNNG